MEALSNVPVKIKGELARVMYPKQPSVHEDGEFGIFKIKLLDVISGNLHERGLDRANQISVKGRMPSFEFSEEYEMTILESELHPTYGMSYEYVFSRENYTFNGDADVKIFLSKILTDIQIKELYSTHSNPMDIISNGNVEELVKVKGIGESTAEKIVAKYYASADYAEAYIELDGYGLSNKAIVKLSKHYGSPNLLIKKIKENPYILTNVDGYGFKKADEIALNGGIDKNSAVRVMAYIDYILYDMGQQGYSWVDSSTLVYMIQENLGDYVEIEVIQKSVEMLKSVGKVWNEEKGKVGSMVLYDLELKIVKEFVRLISAQSFEIEEDWIGRVKQAEILQGWEYTNQQWEAISGLLKENVGILSGLAGSGKTSTALGLVKAIGLDNFKLCCLAGKASARLQEATGYEASTIHRLLAFSDGVFQYDEDCPLKTDLVILDEYSLVGGELFYSLIQAIPTGSRFLMLGDMGQLSSIGSLNISSDTMECDVIPKFELTEIHRQASKSAIITDSINMRHGIQLFDKDFIGYEIHGELQDLEIDIYDNKDSTPKKVLEYFKKYQELESDIMEIQVIAPLNLRGDSSVYALNNMLQKHCNPSSFDDGKPELTLPLNKKQEYIFRIGDKIINVKNNYKLKDVEENEVAVFNGYTGIITDIINDSMTIHFPNAETEYDVVIPKGHWHGKKGIHQGWALSTHKSQGSGFNYVIYCMDESHYVMQCRQQLYTGVTRAKKHCALLGQNSAIRRAISTDLVSDKQTFMKDMLIKHLKE